MNLYQSTYSRFIDTFCTECIRCRDTTNYRCVAAAAGCSIASADLEAERASEQPRAGLWKAGGLESDFGRPLPFLDLRVGITADTLLMTLDYRLHCLNVTDDSLHNH